MAPFLSLRGALATKQSRSLLFVFIAICFLTACHKLPSRTANVTGVRNAQAILVERRVKEDEARAKTLRGIAHVVLADKDELRETDLALVISYPDHIRADAYDTLADIWAAAGTDGRRLWLWLPQKGKLYQGAATPRNLKKLAAFDWEIPELVSIISGLVPGARHAELFEGQGDKKIYYELNDRPIRLWVDPKTKNIKRLVRYKNDEGFVQYEVNFSDYRLVDGAMFPYEIEVTFPERPLSFYVSYKEVEFNATVDSSLFKPETVWRRQTIEIDK